MRQIAYVLLSIFVLVSCQTNEPTGNEIVFGDVIGNYEGECANYTSPFSELMNREEATLSIIASSISTAGMKTSCDRIGDHDMPVKTATAAKIVFEKSIDDIVVTMTYIAVSDSIVIIQTQVGNNDNLIFTGKRI